MFLKEKNNSGFTLLELFVTMVIISVLAIISYSVALKMSQISHDAVCISGLRQMGVAMQAYTNEHNGNFPPYVIHHPNGDKTWYFGYEKAGSGSEGNRKLDKNQGALYPYIQKDTIEICPAFDYESSLYKAKFKGASWAYGYNWDLGGKFLGKPVKNILNKKNSSRVLFICRLRADKHFSSTCFAKKSDD